MNNLLKELDNEIQELSEDSKISNSEKSEVKKIKKDIKEKEKSKEEHLKLLQMYEVAAVLLKDSGIKTRIVKQYLPVINKLVNKYLGTLEFFCEFHLDETFNETIKSRDRDNFSYASFSEGEKKKIDISMMMAWREIAKLRNSTATNLLFLDETFDSSLDSISSDILMGLLSEGIGKKSNVFVISHKSDLYDKFHSNIEFDKERGFSKIVSTK